MRGYELEKIKGKAVWDFLADETQKEELKAYLELLVIEQPMPTPYFQNNLTKDGKIIYVQVNWNYKRNEKGEIIGFISILTDITEPNRIREALQKSEKQYRTLIETMNHGIILEDE